MVLQPNLLLSVFLSSPLSLPVTGFWSELAWYMGRRNLAMDSATVLVDGQHTDLNHPIPGQKQGFDRSDTISTAVAIPSHPLAIKPAGNIYTSIYNLKSAAGYFACLPDELIVEILEYLDARSLIRLEATCKALYGFARFEDLWKTLFIEYVQTFFHVFHNSTCQCAHCKVQMLLRGVFILSLSVIALQEHRS